LSRFAGQKAQDIGEFAGKKTFDVRGTKLGQMAAAKAGLNSTLVGKPAEGGFEGAKKRKDEKREARLKTLQERAAKPHKAAIANAESDLNAKQNELQTLKDGIAVPLGALDKSIDRLGKEFSEKSKNALNSKDPKDKEAADEIYKQLQEAKGEKKKLSENTRTKKADGTEGSSIAAIEQDELPGLQQNVTKKKREEYETKTQVKMNYVKDFDTKFNHTLNTITSLGQYSWKGGKGTAVKMRRVERMPSSGIGSGGNLTQNLGNTLKMDTGKH
jgi:hypothetical protein